MSRPPAIRRPLIAAGVLLVLAAIAVIAVACGDGSEDESTPQAGATAERSPGAAVTEEAFSATEPSGIAGAGRGCNYAAVA